MLGHQTECRLCHSKNLSEVINLGHHPLADTFLVREQLNESQMTYPLGAVLCGDCGHVMTSYVVSPEDRYQKNDYSYDSSNSKVSMQHFSEMATQAIKEVGVTKDDLVIDIGSNVGTLLGAFREQSGCEIIGVEPSHNIAALAKKNNIPTIEGFFDSASVSKILETKRPKVVATSNVFNHVADLDTLMQDISTLLDEKGTCIIQVPYLLTLIEKTSFDTMYLEHVSYFGVKPLVQYFKKYGFAITAIYEYEYMGGSIRFFIKKGATPCTEVAAYIKKEDEFGLYGFPVYEQFMERVRMFKFRLCNEIYAIKLAGGKIIGIGAATKGNTLLNFCKIDDSLLEYITDSSKLKIGKYMPGSHILIKDDKDIDSEITHALILPWNIADFLKTKLGHLGLQFLTPQMEITYENRA